MPTRITVRDVANAAGVHPATVSRALNDATRHVVKPETAERVQRAADALGYEPDLMARTLRTGRTATIGVLVPDFANPLYAPIVRGIDDTLAEHDYATLLGNTDDDLTLEARAFRTLRLHQVDGFILLTARRTDATVKQLIGDKVPIVTVNRVSTGPSACSVTGDDASGMRSVVDHLVELGHRRVASIAGTQTVSSGRTRQRALERALDRHGISLARGAVSQADGDSVSEGQRCANELLDRVSPTAIIAANDLLAIGCLDALRSRGLRCPDDVSVTGFDDLLFVDRLSPPLTTVRLPHRLMGSTAAQLILDRLSGSGVPDQHPPSHLVLPVELVIRGSTGPPR